MNIAFTCKFPQEGFEKLKNHNLNCSLAEADILISAFNTPVNKTMISQMPALQLIANFGVGFDNIDMTACRQRKIIVTNTPHAVVETTAELCWSLVHALVRRTAELDRRVRNNTVEPTGIMSNISHSLYGMQIGIVGMGHIGQAVARRALASGLKICYYNRTPINKDDPRWHIHYPMPPSTQTMHQLALEEAIYTPLPQLLQTSDIISLNLPYTPQVHHLIDYKEFNIMKNTSYFINTARGAIVNQEAMINALQKQIIKGAGLDVYENEPNIDDQLKNLDNVVLSPHVGTATQETRMAMCQEVTNNILCFIQGDFNKMNIVS